MEPSESPDTALSVPVHGGVLHGVAWGGDDGVPVLAIHGITASHLSWAAVTRLLPGGHRVLAPDLRGRGRSNTLPGPSSMARHAQDMVALLDAAGVERAVVAAHSMGGFVAVALADAYPDRVERLVLADGGLPLTLPEGMDLDTSYEVGLGPALARLSMTFPDHAAYRDFWKQHPGLGPYWNADVEAYVEADLEPIPGPGGRAWRSSVRAALVKQDYYDQFTDAVVTRLETLTRPAVLLRAPRGLLDQPQALYADGFLEEWMAKVPLLTGWTVEDVNHYTLLLGPAGAQAVAAAIAGAAAG